MNDPSYLLATIQTLSDSLHEQSAVSTHDLLDAYTTFSNRIRSQGHLLRLSDTHLTALAFLKIHKDIFVRALRRDVFLAHIDPFSFGETSFESGIHPNIDTVTKQYAADSSSLCHHALCALTTIFRFPAFQSVFSGVFTLISIRVRNSRYSEHDLSTLFGDVLNIALADQLPVLNAAKTYSLSLWALSCHRLPRAVLSSRKDDMYFVLQRSLDRQSVNIVLDGIKVRSCRHLLFSCAHVWLLGSFTYNRTSPIRISPSSFPVTSPSGDTPTLWIFRASLACFHRLGKVCKFTNLSFRTLPDDMGNAIQSHHVLIGTVLRRISGSS